MTSTRCVHGIDSRFCAVCNKVSRAAAPRGAIGSVTLTEVLAFLDAEHVRATPRAIGDVIGVTPRALAGQLGDRTGEAGDANVISSGMELALRMTNWKAARRG